MIGITTIRGWKALQLQVGTAYPEAEVDEESFKEAGQSPLRGCVRPRSSGSTMAGNVGTGN